MTVRLGLVALFVLSACLAVGCGTSKDVERTVPSLTNRMPMPKK